MAIFEDYISLKEAASISGYHSDYIGALVRSGKIHGKKIGNRWMVSAEAVKVHFSTKHYAPAAHVFFSTKRVIVGILLLVIILGSSIYFSGVFVTSPQSFGVAAQSTLNEIINGVSASVDGNAALGTASVASSSSAAVITQQP